MAVNKGQDFEASFEVGVGGVLKEISKAMHWCMKNINIEIK